MYHLLSFNYETIDTLIKLFFTMVMVYIPLLNISNLKVRTTEILITMVLTESIIVLVYILFQHEIITSFLIFLSMVTFVYLKKRSILPSVIYAAMTNVLIFTVNNTSGVLYMYFCNIETDSLRENKTMYWTVSLLTFLIALPVSIRIGDLFKKFVPSAFDFKLRVYISVACFFVLTLSVFIINVHLATDESNNILLLVINSILLLIDFAFIVFIAFSFIHFIRQDLELRHNRELLENLKSYIVSVENVQSEMQNYRHDIINILISMYNYIENEDIHKLKNFFDEKINPMLKKTSSYGIQLKHLENIHIFELNGILTIKLINAIENGINVHIEACEPIESLDIEIIDLVRVVGILLDNSIEECQKEKNMLLQFAAIKTKESIKLIFVNQLATPIPAVSKIFEKGYSTKGENRGLGLFSVRKALGKYDHILFKTEIIPGDAFDKISHELIFPKIGIGCDMCAEHLYLRGHRGA